MRRLGALILAGVLLTACDSGPSGPGQLLIRASGVDLGAAVLEIQGSGIREFSARGSTRIYSAPVSAKTGAFRVVIVDPVGTDIGFDVSVDDVGMEGPIVTVVSAADTANQTMSTAGVTVRVER